MSNAFYNFKKSPIEWNNSGALNRIGNYKFPATDGSADEVIKTDGAGQLTFGTAAGGVSGPGSSTDNTIPRFNGTGGDTLQGSGLVISDSDVLQVPSGGHLEVLGNGSVSQPTIALDPARFSVAPGGMYSEGANLVSFAANNQRFMNGSTTRINTYELIASNLADSETSPSYSFAGDTNTGLASSGADELVLICGAAFKLKATATVVELTVPLQLDVLTDSTRGSAGTAGRVFYNSDDGNLNIDNGTNFILPDGTTT